VSVPDFASTATQLGFLANLDRVFDHTGRGSALVRFTVSGRTAAGAPFTVARTNRWVDDADLTFTASEEPAAAVEALVDNDFTAVTLDQVRIDASLSDQVRAYRIGKVQVRVKGRWRTVGSSSVVRVRHGRRVALRVFLASRRGKLGTKVVLTHLHVPASARGESGFVDVGAAAEGIVDDSEDGPAMEDTGSAASFGGLLRALQTAPRNDELALSLQLDSDETGPAVTRRAQVGSVVSGDAQFLVRVR
jgi:hypothetical protein